MNMNKIIKLRFIISLVILSILVIVSIYFNLNLNKNISNVLEYEKINKSLSTNDSGITFEELNKVKETYKNLTFTGYKEISCAIKNKYGNSPSEEIKTKMVLTDEKYFSLYPYKMVQGGKIDFLSVKNGNKIAVISDILAINLFKSIKVIGNTITLSNVKYKIVGVYKENQSLTYSASEDGYERIYVPYSSYTVSGANEKLFLDIFTTKDASQTGYNNINNKLTKTIGGNISLYNMVDYTTLKKISFQYIHMFYFIIGICVIVVLIKITFKYLKNLVAFFREKLKISYFNDILSDNKKGIVIVFSKIILSLISVLIIFNLIKFNIVIEDKYLPPDNIFDVSFYTKTIVDDIQLKNANEDGFSNVYNRYLNNVNHIENMAFLGEVVIFIIIIINGKLLLSLIVKLKE